MLCCLLACRPVLLEVSHPVRYIDSGSAHDSAGDSDSGDSGDSGHSGSENLLENGGFEHGDEVWSEDGTPAGWSRSGAGEYRWLQGEAYEDDFMVALGGDPYASLSQTVEAESGEAFLVTAWARTAGDPTTATVKVEFHTSGGDSLLEYVNVFDAAEDWTEVEISGTAPARTGQVTATVLGTDDHTLFDAVSLTEER